jgi:hypothetical protein
MEFPFLRQRDIEAAAERVLKEALGSRPYALPVNLDAVLFDHLAEREGLSFDDASYLGEVDGDPVIGMMLPAEGRIQICRSLREQGPLGRWRFTIAHEIGHWVLHRSLCQPPAFNLDLFEDAPRVARMVSLNRNVFPHAGHRVPTEEWQANTFAAHLLIPGEELRAAFTLRFGPPPAGAAEGVDRSERARALSKATSARRAVPLHEQFGVSVQAMTIALESRGYLTEQAALL